MIYIVWCAVQRANSSKSAIILNGGGGVIAGDKPGILGALSGGLKPAGMDTISPAIFTAPTHRPTHTYSTVQKRQCKMPNYSLEK